MMKTTDIILHKLDAWDYFGLASAVTGVSVTLADVKEIIQITVGGVSIVFVGLSAVHKYLEIRKLKKDESKKNPK